MRKFAEVLLFLSMLFLATCTMKPTVKSEIQSNFVVEKVSRSVGMVLVEGKRGMGSGICISDSLVLTAMHVVMPEPKVDEITLDLGVKAIVTEYPKEPYVFGDVTIFPMQVYGGLVLRPSALYYAKKGKVVYYDEDRDLALVEFPKNTFLEFCQIRSGQHHKIGSEVYHVGYPSGTPMVSWGKVMSYTLHARDIYMYALSGTTEGSSGGAFFDSEGKLIGLVQKVFTRNQSVSISITHKAINSFLEKSGKFVSR